MKSSFLAITAVLAALVGGPAFAQSAGFGKDIPLELAVRQIVPSESTVQISEGVDKTARVSWDGKDGWQKALNQAVSGAGYVAKISGDKVTIVRAGAVVETVASVPAPAAEKPTTPAARPSSPKPQATPKPATSQPKPRPSQPAPATRRAAPEQPMVSAGGFVFIPEGQVASSGSGDGWQTYGGNDRSAAVVEPPIQEWIVQPGDDLHTVLSEWSSKAGFTLEWKSDYTYELTSGARFTGSMDEAITNLIRSLQNVRPTVNADIHTGNKVVEVWNGGLGEVN